MSKGEYQAKGAETPKAGAAAREKAKQRTGIGTERSVKSGTGRLTARPMAEGPSPANGVSPAGQEDPCSTSAGW